jgi:predicted phosphate transport protein (TIGR00153 family)
MSLFAKTYSFYDQFELHAAKTIEGCELLVSLLADASSTDVRDQATAISELEHQCDRVTHGVVAQLRQTLITPLDRNEIYRLITKMDDVMDFIEATSERMALYDIRESSPVGAELARVLLASCACVLDALKCFRNMKQPQPILDKCSEINRLENQADSQLRTALAALFRNEANPITIMKWKEIYELLETASDRCEDVANIIEGVVLENS